MARRPDRYRAAGGIAGVVVLSTGVVVVLGGVVGVPWVGIAGDVGISVLSDGIVGGEAGETVGVIELSTGIVVLALSVALPVIVRVLLSDAVVLVLGVSDIPSSELCVLAQAAVNTSDEATARP